MIQVQGGSRKNKRTHIVSDETLHHAEMTHIGLERAVNEDRCVTISTRSGVSYFVLDGMGGAEGGEFAAQIGVDAIRRSLSQDDSGDVMETLTNALDEANRTILLRRESQHFKEMGTAVVGAVIERSAVAIGHVGDSRAYLVHGEEVLQLTVDHTYVQQLVDRNEITEEEAMAHPQSHVLTQCLGSSSDIQADGRRYWIWPLEKGELPDFLVLCTDGLYSLVHDDEMRAIVTTSAPAEACQELIRLANERGGYDNITVSIIPLHGHLRAEEPPRRAIEMTKRKREDLVGRWWRRSLVFHILIASVVGAGFSVAALALFFYLRVF